jgi:hypothetical protein
MWCPPRVFVLFFFVLCTLWCGVHHGYTGRRKTKQKHVVDTTNIGYTGRRKTKQKHVVDTTNIGCFCFIFLRPVYPVCGVHHVFLLYFSSSCVPYVCGVHHVFLFCFSSSCKHVVDTTNIGYTGRRKTKQKHVVDTTNIGYTGRRKTTNNKVTYSYRISLQSMVLVSYI